MNIEPLPKVKKRFHEFTKKIETEIQKLAAIKAFDYSIEQTQHVLTRVLKHAFNIRNIKNLTTLYSQAAKNSLIEDPEIWFEFIKMRNITSHSYNEEAIEEIVAIFPDFRKALDTLIRNLLIIK